MVCTYEGQLYLDATYSMSKPVGADAKRLRMISTTLDVVHPIQLGRRLETELDDAGICLEIVVRKVNTVEQNKLTAS